MGRGEDERWYGVKDAAGADYRDEEGRDYDDRGVKICCCGLRWGGGGGGSRKAALGNGGDDVLRTKGRWQVDDDDEYYKPPVWKQIIQKVKAQTRQQLNATSSIARGEWVNYDPQSYEKNFDNGSWRDTSRQTMTMQYDESFEQPGLKERPLHTALLQKFSSSGSQKLETVPKPDGDFDVPIWQRRASSPITLEVRQRA